MFLTVQLFPRKIMIRKTEVEFVEFVMQYVLRQQL